MNNQRSPIQGNSRFKKYYVIFLFLSFFTLSTRQIYAAALTTSGVLYNADSSANIARSRSTSVRVPENLVAPTQGWVAIRVKMGFPSTTTLAPDPVMWDLSQSDPNDLFVYYDIDTDTFHFPRRTSGSGPTLASVAQSFQIGAVKTVVAAWTSTQIKISVDGGAFRTASSTNIPSQASFLIGSTLVQGSGRQPNSDYYWVAAGTGTLTDANVLSIHNFGNTDKKRSDFPGNATFIWWANSNTYNDDGGTGPTNPPGTATPLPTSTPRPTNTPTPRPTNTSVPGQTSTPTPRPTNTGTPRPTGTGLPGDGNGDGKVDGIDFVIWLNRYGQSVGGATNGDYNNDNKVDGIDYVIWLSNYGRTQTTLIPTNIPTQAPINSITAFPTSPPGGNSTACFGAPPDNPSTSYPERRVFLESQSWWTDSRVAFPGAHIHAGTCFPLFQDVRGTVRFDVRALLHADPGLATFFRLQLWPTIDPAYRENISWRCPTPNCIRWFIANIDTTQSSTDGSKELRMTVNIPNTPNGNQQFVTSRIHMTLRNGKAVSDYEPNKAGGAAWYTGSDYTEVLMDSTNARRAAFETVNGTWTFQVRGTRGNLYVSVDPDFHNGKIGDTVFTGGGSGFHTMSVDTRKYPNGTHRLFMRTDDHLSSGTAASAFVIPFNVQN